MSSIVGRRYRLDELLGQGGMGSVYCAHDLELNRKVALKFLSAAISQDKDFHSRFIREAKSLARVQNERLVTLYDSDEENGQLYIVQEFLDGESLAEICDRRGPLKEDEALSFFKEAAEGLACLHEAGLIHRDIKPDNIFVDEEKGLKLLDFGLVLDLELTRLTPDNVALGTRLYLSPELIKSPSVTPASDIFQIGLVLHEMLTAKLLDRNYDCQWHDLIALSDDRKETPPPDLSISEPLRMLIRDCCRKRVEERIQDGRELLRRLATMGKEETGALTAIVIEAHQQVSEVEKKKGREFLGKWLKPAVVFSFFILVMVLSFCLSHSHVKIGQNKPPTFRIVEMATFPDGLYLRVEKKMGCELKVKYSAGPQFQEEQIVGKEEREALLDLVGSTKSKDYSLRLEADDGSIFEQRHPVPKSPFSKPLMVRATGGEVKMQWQLNGNGRVEIESQISQGNYESEGFHQNVCILSFKEKEDTRGSHRLRYRMKLGKRILASGEVAEGFRRVFNLTTSLEDERLVADLHFIDHRGLLHLITRKGKWVALRAIESPSGLFLKKQWIYDFCLTLSKFRRGGHLSAGCERAYFHQLQGKIGLFAFEKDGCLITCDEQRKSNSQFAISRLASFPHRPLISTLADNTIVAASTNKVRKRLLVNLVKTNPLKTETLPVDFQCSELFANIAHQKDFYLCGRRDDKLFLVAYRLTDDSACKQLWLKEWPTSKRTHPFRYEDYPLSLSLLKGKNGLFGLCLLLPPTAYIVDLGSREEGEERTVIELPTSLDRDSLVSLTAHSEIGRTTLLYANWQYRGNMPIFKRVGLLSFFSEDNGWKMERTRKEVKVPAFSDLQRLVPIVVTSKKNFVGSVDSTVLHFDGKSLELVDVYQHPTNTFEGIRVIDDVVLCFGPSSFVEALDL